MTLAQFNAVFSASSTSHIKHPAESGIMGDLTPLQPVKVNIFLFVFMSSAMIALHALAQVQMSISKM
jgi:hypothetical protein